MNLEGSIAYRNAIDAISKAHWLSGHLHERIAALIKERELALEGLHPIQLARAERLALFPGINIISTTADSHDARLFEAMFASQDIRHTTIVDLPMAVKTAKGKLNPSGGAIAVAPDGEVLRTMFDICEWINRHGLQLM